MSDSLSAGREVMVTGDSFEVKEGTLLWVLIPNDEVDRYRCVIRNTQHPYHAALHYVVEINEPGFFTPGDEVNRTAIAMCFPLVEKIANETWRDKNPTPVSPANFVAVETDLSILDEWEPNIIMSD